MLSSSSGAAGPTLNLSERLRTSGSQKPLANPLTTSRNFTPDIEISNLSFSYDDSNAVIRNLNLSVKSGDFLAIAGPSGAGKSTLIDLCLGILEPVSGSVSISDTAPIEAIRLWPGKIAYVPQSVHLANMSLRDNLVFFSNVTENVDQKCLSVLAQTGLAEEFAKTNVTLDTIIGSDQNTLSGGQVQRIGIARALFSNPDLLILDESTSSLDAGTEHQINGMISNLPGKITRIVIAHRLSTIVAANKILYLNEEGNCEVGTFQSLRASNKEFNYQVSLLGL